MTRFIDSKMTEILRSILTGDKERGPFSPDPIKAAEQMMKLEISLMPILKLLAHNNEELLSIVVGMNAISLEYYKAAVIAEYEAAGRQLAETLSKKD